MPANVSADISQISHMLLVFKLCNPVRPVEPTAATQIVSISGEKQANLKVVLQITNFRCLTLKEETQTKECVKITTEDTAAIM